MRAMSTWMFESPVAHAAALVLAGEALILASPSLIVRASNSTLLDEAERMVRAALGDLGWPRP